MNFVMIYQFYLRMKIEKVKKLVANLHDKIKNFVHRRNLKQTLNHGLVSKKVHRVIKFTQYACLTVYIDMNTDLRKKAKSDFKKGILKLSIMQFLKKLWTLKRY